MKLTKNDKKGIRGLSKQLPKMTYRTEHLKAKPGKKPPYGIDDFDKVVNTHKVNHERRLRRAYKSNGNAGVMAYLKQFETAEA